MDPWTHVACASVPHCYGQEPVAFLTYLQRRQEGPTSAHVKGSCHLLAWMHRAAQLSHYWIQMMCALVCSTERPEARRDVAAGKRQNRHATGCPDRLRKAAEALVSAGAPRKAALNFTAGLHNCGGHGMGLGSFPSLGVPIGRPFLCGPVAHLTLLSRRHRQCSTLCVPFPAT